MQEEFTGKYAHVFNRGVDKRTIFEEDNDRIRFIYSLAELNDQNRISDQSITKSSYVINSSDSPFVQIMAFALMPNHYHILLEELVEGGISSFIGRLGNSYTKYFNIKNDRSGRLFESKYKSVNILTDSHLLHITRYIHLNPLSLYQSNWKEEGVKDWVGAESFLENYRWSSYMHYINLEKIGFVDSTLFDKEFEGAEDYKKFMQSWAASDLRLIDKKMIA